MAGGIFPNYPFEINIKCVIFSILIIFLFFYSPPKWNVSTNLFIGFILFVVAYVAMAWYDYKFQCEALALRKSTGGLTDKLKPPQHSEAQTDRTKMTDYEIALEKTLIHLFHILIVAPLLFYIALRKNTANESAIIPLITTFVFGMVYHFVRAQRKFKETRTIGYIPLIHFLFGIFAIFVILSKKYELYNIFYVLSVYALGKHSLELIQTSHSI